LPLAITIWVLHAVLNTLDGVFEAMLSASQAVLPEAARAPLQMLKHVPGLGVIVMIAGLLLTGVFAANIAGQMGAAPRQPRAHAHPHRQSIYSSVKQVSDTCSRAAAMRSAKRCSCSTRAKARDHRLRDRQAGRRGGRSSARRLSQPVRSHHAQPDFWLLSSWCRQDVIALSMTVDEALKYIISMGVSHRRRT